MNTVLLSLLALVPVAALVHLGLDQLAKLTAKTKNKVDDKIVALIRSHTPELVEALERLVKAQEADTKTRERVLDHRT